jgi:putative tricarboxylic transport membrane protein
LRVPLTEVAFKFGPAEYFSLMVLGLIGAVVLASGSLLKAVGMIVLGLLMGLVGTDVNSGVARFSFDIPELTDGIGFVTIAMGVFGYGEIISQPLASGRRRPRSVHCQGGRPVPHQGRLQAHAARRAARHGAGFGALGILPGGGACCRLLRPTPSRRRPSCTPAKCPLAKAISVVWRLLKPPTTRVRKPRSSRC